MSYLDQSRRTSPGSMAAVVAIHAALGVALVTGLTVSGVIQERDILHTWDLKDPPPPPPPEVEPPKPEPKDATFDPPVNVPVPTLDLVRDPPKVPTTTEIFPPLPPIPQPTGPAALPDPVPSASFTPTPAKPRNPGSWLSDDDYRPGWVRQEMTGTARFRLQIAANGRVAGCEVTGSTGHAPLDEATCALVTKRARFDPARGRDGEAVAGSYTGSVFWKLPE